MSYDLDEYDVESLYAADPIGATNAVIAEAAALAAAEVAALRVDHREEDFRRLERSQIESAVATATSQMETKYGPDWQRLRPRLEERIARSPHLVPDQVRTSPGALAQSLDDVFRLVREDAKIEDEANYWEDLKKNNPTLPSFS